MSTRKTTASRRWTPEEDKMLSEQVRSYTGTINWVTVAESHEGRSNKDCRNRWMKIKCKWSRGAWTEEENTRLTLAVATHGHSWTSVSDSVGTRSPDQCAKHWTNTLDPDIIMGGWTDLDDQSLMEAVHIHGRSWKKISAHYFPNRSTLEISNRWETGDVKDRGAICQRLLTVYRCIRYNLNIRRSEQSGMSVFGNIGSDFPLSPMDAGFGTKVDDHTVALMSYPDGVATGWHDPILDYGSSFAASDEPDLLHPTPSTWVGALSSGYDETSYLSYGNFPSFSQLDRAVLDSPMTASAGVSDSPLSTSDPPTPITTTGFQRQRNEVQRTSLTMENLDPDTRNEILDILCRRKISTTIGMS
ncbi:hypothetical protein B0T14DRAFT_328240 [Immersiella caudata]|uniref:Uncharacterized protein n=1 Tax=Immersiella caudata TaxID=314043 RepID=A0AA39U5J6_9PEZI|nr:hypothetical protein B0T14DRAFT_328240 [Immersiella caudata]